MNTHLKIAYDKLLFPAKLEEQVLWELINSAMKPSVDYVDLYFQLTQGESWTLEDGIIKTGGFGIDKGVGIRVIEDEKTGFAFCDEINLENIKSAIGAAQGIVRNGKQGATQIITANKKIIDFPLIYTADNPLISLQEEEKIKLLQNVDREARKQDPRIIQVIANLAGAYEIVFIIATDGCLAADVRPQVKLNVTVIVEDRDRREQGFAGAGGRTTYQIFTKQGWALKCAREAVRIALINLQAAPTPAGKMPVILGKGWPAVLIHEAIGHGLEGDSIRKGSSKFANKFGEQVASPLCTIVDQGNLKDRRGSLNIDDEATPTQMTTLIENGILRGCLQDKLNAKLMNMQPTGNARRESYAYIPVPRMTNTYMLPGKSDPQEIIASVDKGIYAVNFSGGQVDVTSGEFVFSMSEAYLIENGKVTNPIKGATLIGNGIEVLRNVTMVGNDLAFDDGVGSCGKEGQTIPVGVGQPTLKVAELTVGGTK